jgi:hypothetical protein
VRAGNDAELIEDRLVRAVLDARTDTVSTNGDTPGAVDIARGVR